MAASSRQSTIDAKGNRLWVYPQKIKGFFTKNRAWVSYLLIVLYLGMPWIKINGLPLFQLDIAHRQFILGGVVFWPQDIKYFVFLVIGAGLCLFFFTAVAGRLWCGWACPQTVFLEFVFRRIEEWIEGDRNRRIALDKAPWTPKKFAKKAAKQLIFIVIAWVIANTFLAYFVGTNSVLKWLTQPPSQNWTAFIFMMINFLLLYFDFGWFREQFCTTLCPYARLQAAFVDEHTFQVTYDFKRGEPRGKVSQEDRKDKGDCVDCGLCVRVCPTGIDIRDGSQLDCIGCARCIDACDSIMTKVNRPLGLVRYASEAQIEGKKTALFRPRIVLYAVLLIGLAVGLGWAVSHRDLLEFAIARPPGDPYMTLPNGDIANHLTLNLANKTQKPLPLLVKMDGLKDAELIVAVSPFVVPPNSYKRLEIFVSFSPKIVPTGKQPITLRILEGSRELAHENVVLLGPMTPKKRD